MAEENNNQQPQQPEPPPPPQSAEPPPPPPPPTSSGSGGGGSDKTLMLVLSYLWLFALIPLLVEKEDKAVQWHAKNGLVLFVAEIILYVGSMVIQVIPVIGSILGCLVWLVVFFGSIILRIMAIMKATKGERFHIPYISEYADKF